MGYIVNTLKLVIACNENTNAAGGSTASCVKSLLIPYHLDRVTMVWIPSALVSHPITCVQVDIHVLRNHMALVIPLKILGFGFWLQHGLIKQNVVFGMVSMWF